MNENKNKKDSRQSNKDQYQTKGWRKQATPKNDPFWYALDERQITNMASFPWSDVHGAHIGNTADTVPGIVVYPWVPAINTAFAGTDYTQSAADAYFHYLTQGFTGNIEQFESADLLMSALATNMVHAYLLEGRRAYGIVAYFLRRNSYYARTLVEALGFDYDDLAANLANFRTSYNLKVAEINSVLVAPKGFKIGDRWEFLSSYIFCDDPDPELATAYCYRMDRVLKYDGFGLSTGTALKYETVPKRRTVAQFFDQVQDLLKPLVSHDMRDMNGALKRVYSDGALRYAQPLDESWVTQPVHYDVVCTALHNALTYDRVQAPLDPTVAVDYVAQEGYAVYQSDGDIHCRVYGLTMGATNAVSYLRQDSRYIIDVWDGNTNPGYVLDATVHMTPPLSVDTKDLAVSEDETLQVFQRLCPRTEILLSPIIFSKSPTNADTVIQYEVRQVVSNTDPVSWDAMCRFSHLDNHPYLHIGMVGSSVTHESRTSKKISTMLYMGDIHEYTTLAAYDLIRMHNQAMYTLLSMPENTKSVTK